jgi:hypothetical protein
MNGNKFSTIILQLFLTHPSVTLMTPSTHSRDWHVLIMNDQCRTRIACIKYRNQSRYHFNLLSLIQKDHSESLYDKHGT